VNLIIEEILFNYLQMFSIFVITPLKSKKLCNLIPWLGLEVKSYSKWVKGIFKKKKQKIKVF
jgi:hypothetical protein